MLGLTYRCVSLLVLQLIDEGNFNDLGKLLLFGFAAALLLAIALVFLKMRLRERKPEGSTVISITSKAED
ncbi:MAG: hypothetical protein ABR555_13755 [Pyrinomonadaceae bacterium]